MRFLLLCMMTSRIASVQIMACRCLHFFRSDWVLAALSEAMQSANKDVRIAAARSLGRKDNRGAIEVLVRGLVDREARAACTLALAKITDDWSKQPEAERALPVLFETAEKNWRLALEAVELFGDSARVVALLNYALPLLRKQDAGRPYHQAQTSPFEAAVTSWLIKEDDFLTLRQLFEARHQSVIFNTPALTALAGHPEDPRVVELIVAEAQRAPLWTRPALDKLRLSISDHAQLATVEAALEHIAKEEQLAGQRQHEIDQAVYTRQEDCVHAYSSSRWEYGPTQLARSYKCRNCGVAFIREGAKKPPWKGHFSDPDSCDHDWEVTRSHYEENNYECRRCEMKFGDGGIRGNSPPPHGRSND